MTDDQTPEACVFQFRMTAGDRAVSRIQSAQQCPSEIWLDANGRLQPHVRTINFVHSFTRSRSDPGLLRGWWLLRRNSLKFYPVIH